MATSLEDLLECAQARVARGRYVTFHQGMGLLKACKEAQQDIQCLTERLNAYEGQATADRASKALVEDAVNNEGEAQDYLEQEDFVRSTKHDRQAEKIESALRTLYDVQIEHDREESGILHIYRGATKHWLDFSLIEWEWSMPVSKNREQQAS